MGTKTDRIEQIRQRLGLNKTEFADAMGITPNYYYNILSGSGTSNLRLEHLESLLVRHHVNPAWIMTGKGEPFLNAGEGDTEWIAGHIIPEVRFAVNVDEDLLSYLVLAVLKESRLPILASDMAYSLCVRFGRYYIDKYPNATQETLDIPALTASFLTLLLTVQSLVTAAFELEHEGKVVVSFEGRYYNFQRPGQPAK